jgi:hypothetical protein
LVALLFTTICLAGEADGSWVVVEGPRHSSIPFKVSSNYKVFVDVTIAGEKHQAMVDTGAVTTLSLRLARRLGVPLVLTEDRPVGLSGDLGKHWTTQAALQIGEMKVSTYPIQCIDLTSFHDSVTKNGGDDFDLIIGADLLVFLRAELDFDKSELVLKRPKTLVPKRSN